MRARDTPLRTLKAATRAPREPTPIYSVWEDSVASCTKHTRTCHKPSRFTTLRFCIYRTQMVPGHGPTHSYASPSWANAPTWAGVSDRMPSSARNRLSSAPTCSQTLREATARSAATPQCSGAVVVFFNPPNKTGWHASNCNYL